MKLDVYRVGVAAHCYRAHRFLTLPASDFPAALDPPVTWRWRISRAWTEIRYARRSVWRNLRAGKWRELRNTLYGWRAEPDPFPETGLVGIGYGLTRNGALYRLARRVNDADRLNSHPDHLAILILAWSEYRVPFQRPRPHHPQRTDQQ